MFDFIRHGRFLNLARQPELQQLLRCLRLPLDHNHPTWIVKPGSVVLQSTEPSRLHCFMIVEYFDQSCACFEIALLYTLTITKPILVREIFPGSSCHCLLPSRLGHLKRFKAEWSVAEASPMNWTPQSERTDESSPGYGRSMTYEPMPTYLANDF